MYSRIVRSTSGNHCLRDFLVSLFIAELMNPGEELYLISPYLSNIPFIDNDLDQYSDVFPLKTSRQLYLSDILQTLAWKGTNVRIICDPSRSETKQLYNVLRDVAEFRVLEDNHEKGLFSEHVYVHGSMNFTYRGVFVNKENVRSTWQPSEVYQALIAARERWEDSMQYEG